MDRRGRHGSLHIGGESVGETGSLHRSRGTAMADTSVRQQKDKTEVEIIFINGSKIRGYFYVTKNQRVADVLNDNRAFIPFADANNEIHLISKTKIVDVEPTQKKKGEGPNSISINDNL